MSRGVVELAGPAGAGKTTLAWALKAPDLLATTIGVPVGPLRLLSGLGASGPSLVAARATSRGRWWTREELRGLAYLAAWRSPVRRHGGGARDGLLVLDHGPVFRLAALLALGPPMARSRAFTRRWDALAREWGGLLDVVVWLDAPDEVLRRRIDERDRDHRIRSSSASEAATFLERYRAAYRRTLGVVTAAGARLVELDPTASTPDELAEQVRRIVRATPSPGGFR